MIARGATARRRGLAFACGALLLVAAAGPARAARFALLVGNDQGRASDVQLRFAESDARRFADVLRRLGGFSAETTLVRAGAGAGEVRRALGVLDGMMRAAPGDHLVLVYYSGHADAQALHLGSSSLPLAEIKDAVMALPATTHLIILDACQAGALTRAKGGKAGPGFEVMLGARGEETQGLAVLASSSASELAQESDELGGSVFTHYLQAGLSGLADRNRDGKVSLGEVFEYTSDRTLAATLGTATGPQHPTFRLDLTGRDDVVLTQPGLRGAGHGHLRLDVPGWYFVRRGDGSIAFELDSHGDETLALAPDAYQVTRRERSRMVVADVSVTESGLAAISAAPARVVAFGSMVRKGGGPRAAFSLAAGSAARTPIAGLGPSIGGVLVGRVDASAFSVEARAGFGRAHSDADRLSTTTWETSGALAALRMRDAGAGTGSSFVWGYGLEAGLAHHAERLDDGQRRASLAPFGGPVLIGELALGRARRFFLRGGVDASVYALRTSVAGAAAAWSWRPALGVSLGGGCSF